jgi:hypothetical protein
MRLAGFALAFLATAAMTGPLCAACTKPDPPACATQRVPFANDDDADDCRMQMLAFRDGMDAYATCLGQASPDDEKAARADYEDIRVRFNRRARGEF